MERGREGERERREKGNGGMRNVKNHQLILLFFFYL